MADVYGPGMFAQTTLQAGSAGPRIAAQLNDAANATAPSDAPGAIAHALLSTPAGVLLLVAGALIVFSITD